MQAGWYFRTAVLHLVLLELGEASKSRSFSGGQPGFDALVSYRLSLAPAIATSTAMMPIPPRNHGSSWSRGTQPTTNYRFVLGSSLALVARFSSHCLLPPSRSSAPVEAHILASSHNLDTAPTGSLTVFDFLPRRVLVHGHYFAARLTRVLNLRWVPSQ